MSIGTYPLLLTIPVSGTLAVGDSVSVAVPFDAEVVAVTGAVKTAPVGADLLFSIRKNGTAVAATETTIAAGATVATTVKAPPGVTPGQNVITPTVNDQTTLVSLVDADVVDVDVTQVGSTTAGADLVVTLHLIKR